MTASVATVVMSGSLRSSGAQLGRAVEDRTAPAVDERGLEGCADGVETLVLHRRGEDLDAGRQAVLVGETGRDRHAGDAGEVGRDGGDVVEVHGHRVLELVAELERRRGRGR